jgi:hypothetical protein
MPPHPRDELKSPLVKNFPSWSSYYLLPNALAKRNLAPGVPKARHEGQPTVADVSFIWLVSSRVGLVRLLTE